MMGEQTTRVLKPCNATATNVILTILLIIYGRGSWLMAIQYLQGLCESVEASVHAVNGSHHELRDVETKRGRQREREREKETKIKKNDKHKTQTQSKLINKSYKDKNTNSRAQAIEIKKLEKREATRGL
jgi:hypothetical protein